jgi:hypothetical protein
LKENLFLELRAKQEVPDGQQGALADAKKN